MSFRGLNGSALIRPDWLPQPPDFYAQTSAITSKQAAKVWLDAKKNEMTQIDGATWFRAAYDEKSGVLLLEGWLEKPALMTKPSFKTIGGES